MKVKPKFLFAFIVGILIIIFLIFILDPFDFNLTGSTVSENLKDESPEAFISFVIEIIKGERLDSNRNFISDIYDEVKALDDVWSETISSGNYVRITFEENLTSENDITIYPRIISGNPRIEVYEADGTEVIAEFINMNSNEYNQILFPDFKGYQDTFDLKILDGSLEFDYIYDARQLNTVSITSPTNDTSVAQGNQFTYSCFQDYGGGSQGGTTGDGNWTYCAGAGCNPTTPLTTSTTDLTGDDTDGQHSNPGTTDYTASQTVTANDGGIYWLRCNAEDQDGPLHSSGLYKITITSDNPPYFTSIPANVSGTYGTVNVNAVFDFADDNAISMIFINDTSDFTMTNSTKTLTNNSPLTAGNYALNVTINDSANNINWTIFTVDVNQATPTGSLTNNETWSSETYPASITIGLSTSNTGDSDLVYDVWRDNVDKNTGESVLLGVGDYTYNLNTTGGQNYTANASMDPQTLTINANTGSCQVLFNESSGLDYPGTFLAYTDCNSDFTLRRNGTTITNNTEQSLAAGAYNFSVQRTDTANYSNTYNEAQFIITPDATSPTWSDNSANGTYAGEWIQHSVKWVDNIVLSGYIFEFDNGTGSFNNDSFVTLSGASNWSNVTKYINETDSTIRWRVYANDSSNNWNSTDIFQYNSISDTPPQWSNQIESPTDSPVYSVGTNYQFNVTWTDDNDVSIVFIEHNFTGALTNYTVSNISSVWFYEYNNLSAGFYFWRMYANDTLNAWNVTNQFDYTVTQATPTGTLTINETWTEVYPTSVTIGLSESNGGGGDVTYTVWRDNLDKSTGESVLLGFGTYTYKLNTTGGINYTLNANMDSQTLIISKNSGSCSVYFNESSGITYPSQFEVYTNCTSDYTLYQNGTSISNASVIDSGAGAYNFSVQRTDTTNYSNVYNEQEFQVSKATSTGSLTNTDAWIITYPEEVTIGLSASNSGDSDVVYEIYRNGTNISTGETWTPPAGAYEYILNSSGGANYTANASMDAQMLTVNKNSGSCSVYFNESSGITYPSQFEVYTNCTSDYTLYQNGTSISNASVIDSGAGAYNFSVQRTDTTNYSNIYDEKEFQVSKATGEIATYINEVGGDKSELLYNKKWLNATLVTPSSGNIELWYNDTKIEEGASPLSNLTNFTGEGVWNVSGIYSGNENYTSDIETWWVTVSSDSPPTLSIIYPQNIFYNTNVTNITYTVTDDSLSFCWYSLNEGGENSSLYAACPNFTSLSSSEESNTWTVYANDSIGQLSIDVVTFTKDTTYPTFSNFIEDPSEPVNYSPGASYQFNVTITEDNLDTVLIDFDGTNYTPTQTGNVFDFIITDLSVGVYNYFWFVNDSASNINTSASDYTIDPNTGSCSIYFNESSGITYPATFRVYTNCTTDFTLYRNGTSISNNSVQNSGAGAYNFSVQRTDSSNYSNTFNQQEFQVTQATPTITKLLNGVNDNVTVNYPTGINASGLVDNGYLEIYRNGTNVTLDNNLNITLAVNYYEYTFNVTGNQNYSDIAGEFLYATINKTSSEVNLTVNNTDDNITIVQDSSIYLNTTTITGDSGATLRMYKGGSLIDQGNSPLSNSMTFNDVGVFNITGFYLESENYTGSFETWFVNVTETPDVTNPIVTLLKEPSDPVTYDPNTVYEFNATVNDTRAISAVLLEFNGTNYTLTNYTGDIYNFSITGLAVGTYDYRWYANDTASPPNVNSTENGSHTVIQAIPSFSLVLSPSDSETYGTQTNATGSNCPSQLTCTLYRNGVNVTSENGQNVTLGVGVYNYTYNTTGNANYTSYSNSSNLTIAQATPVLTKYLNGDDNITITYPTNVNASATTTQGVVNVYRNGTEVTSENNLDVSLSANYYQYEFNVTGNENYTDLSSVYLYATVNQGTGDIELYLNNSRSNITINPNTEIYLNATLVTGEGNVELYNNSVLINQGISPLNNLTNFISNGLYNISAIYSGNVNYTSDIETFFVNVKDIIIIMDEFNGTVTDLNSFSNAELLNVSNLTLEVALYGKIIFSENITITENTNLDANIDIANNSISLDSSILSNFNKPATLYLYNLDFVNPRVLRDGTVCPPSICADLNYSGEENLSFTVTEFTEYRAEETPSGYTPPGGSSGSRVVSECVNDNECKGKDEVCLNHKCVKLFDIKIIDFESPVKLGEFFDFTYLIKGMADINGDVEVQFWIEKKGNVVTSGSDTIYLGSFEEKTEVTKIFLPSDVESGTYTFFIQVVHEKYKAKAYRTIEIEVKDGLATITPIKKDLKTYIIFILIGLVVLMGLIIIFKKRRIKLIKKYPMEQKPKKELKRKEKKIISRIRNILKKILDKIYNVYLRVKDQFTLLREKSQLEKDYGDERVKILKKPSRKILIENGKKRRIKKMATAEQIVEEVKEEGEKKKKVELKDIKPTQIKILKKQPVNIFKSKKKEIFVEKPKEKLKEENIKSLKEMFEESEESENNETP